MVDAISGGQSPDMQMIQQMMKNHKPEDIFKQISLDAGGDGSSITKQQLEDLSKKAKADGKDTKMLDDLTKNFDKVFTGKDSDGNSVIKADDLEKAMKNGTLKPPGGGPKGPRPSGPPPGGAKPSDGTSTNSGSSDKLTKDQLQSYLSDLKSMKAGNSNIARQIQQAISNGSSSLTKAEIEKAIQDLKSKENSSGSSAKNNDDWQTSFSKDDVTPPIDFKV